MKEIFKYLSENSKRPKYEFVHHTVTGHYISSGEFLRSPVSKERFSRFKQSKLYRRIKANS